MDIIFNDILTLLSAIPELKWIDYNDGQLDLPDESYPVLMPCALIDVTNIDWQGASRGAQTGEATITITVAFDIYEDVHSRVSPSHRAAALSRLAVLNTIHAALQGRSGANYRALHRTNSATERRNDGLKVIVLTYKTTVTDTHGQKQNTVKFTEADITVTH